MSYHCTIPITVQVAGTDEPVQLHRGEGLPANLADGELGRLLHVEAVADGKPAAELVAAGREAREWEEAPAVEEPSEAEVTAARKFHKRRQQLRARKPAAPASSSFGKPGRINS